jgi:hypothetical protein
MSHNPNPAQYGWNYQGSNQASKVEFYEKDGVKMDYYYTTGKDLYQSISTFGALRTGIQHIMHSTVRWHGAVAWLRKPHHGVGRLLVANPATVHVQLGAAIRSSMHTSGSISHWSGAALLSSSKSCHIPSAHARMPIVCLLLTAAASTAVVRAAGTVKNSMDHPSQGKTQMFTRDLDDSQFQSVCQNPRAHTGQGYQTKSSKNYNGK